MAPVSACVVGDVHGRFGKLYERVAELAKASDTTFECVLCVGEFFPREEDGRAGTEGVDVSEYLSGRLKAPLPTYFLGGSDFNGLESLKAIGASGVFCENMEFLGSAGVRELHGLQVAFASDADDPSYQEGMLAALADAASGSGFAGVDILLTNSWPAAIADAEHLGEAPAAPAPLRRPCMVAGCAAAMMRPRYHFAAGASHWARAAYENASVPHVASFTALAPLTGGIDADGPGRKALYALEATTLASLPPAELWARPKQLTPCPYDTKPAYLGFPVALRSQYAALIAEVCGQPFPRTAGAKPAAKKKPAKPMERRAAAVVGYSDDESSDDDSDDNDNDSNDSDDSDSDSGAEEAKRAAKRRKAAAAPAPVTRLPVAAPTNSLLGSVEDLFATTETTTSDRKTDAFQAGEWDRTAAEVQLRENIKKNAMKAAVNFINDG